MLQRVVFCGGLLLNVQYASAAATWKTPTTGADLKANTQDSVWLDWTSTYTAPILRMLCKDEANGGNLVTVSHFEVDTNGPFEYIMDSFLEPNKMKYPLACHAQLAKDEADTAGLDCPVGIVWSYDASKAMKTVSAIQAAAAPTTAKSEVASTPTPTPDPVGSASTTGSPSKVIAPPSVAEKSTTESPSQVTTVPPSTTEKPTTEKSTTDSPSQSTTPPSSTDQSTDSSSSQSTTNPTSSSTDQPSTPSKGSSASDSNTSTAPVATTSSSSNNTGAIVGGVVGGIAVLAFIVFGLLFLRRQKRNRTSFTPVTNNESSIWNFYFFNAQKRREQKMAAGPVYEKEGGGMARELEANAAGGKGNHAVPYDPVELPVGSNQYP
ncbi:hypothetical protein V499_07473 [Pseudogymnoascus sp. VKM F-103]|nr:hypothetical protein V499_07473 [Pseudogymnoascus sp. VKM F-103]